MSVSLIPKYMHCTQFSNYELTLGVLHIWFKVFCVFALDLGQTVVSSSYSLLSDCCLLWWDSNGNRDNYGITHYTCWNVLKQDIKIQLWQVHLCVGVHVRNMFWMFRIKHIDWLFKVSNSSQPTWYWLVYLIRNEKFHPIKTWTIRLSRNVLVKHLQRDVRAD